MGAFGEVWLGKGRQKEGSPGTVFPMAEEWECLVCSGRGQWPVKGTEGSGRTGERTGWADDSGRQGIKDGMDQGRHTAPQAQSAVTPKSSRKD